MDFQICSRPASIGRFAVLIICSWSAFFAAAQSTLGTAGGRAESPVFTLDWSLGEVFVSESKSGSLLLTEGFHQPFLKGNIARTAPAEVADRSANGSTKVSEIAAVCWPNPTGDQLFVQVSAATAADVRLLDGRGQTVRIFRNGPTDLPLEISTAGLSGGIYFLECVGADGLRTAVQKITVLR